MPISVRYLLVRWFMRMATLAGVVVAAGCAHVTPGMSGAGLDRERLSHAVSLDDDAHVRALVEARVISVNDVVPGVGYAATPLITVAARQASLKVLRYLIAANADLNARTPDNDTALMLASFFAQEDRERGTSSHERYDQAVRLLVEAGAELENYGNAYTPLSYAAYSGRNSTLRYLLDKGARVNADANVQRRTIGVNTPLMMAAIQGHQAAVQQLLRAGADAGVRLEGGMSAMDFARKYQHTHLMPMLRCAENLGSGEAFSKRCE